MAIITEAPAPERRGRAPLVRRVVTAVVVLALLGLLAHWLTDDRALAPYGLTVSSTVPSGQTVYADAGVFPRGGGHSSFSLAMSSLKPRVTTNTAGAAVTVVLCSQAGPTTRIGLTASWANYCTLVVPFDSGSLLIDDTTIQVLLEVTPRHPGVVHIEGLDASYRNVIRHGRQHVGTNLTITAS